MKLLPGFSRRFRLAFLCLTLTLWPLTAYVVLGPSAKQNVMPGPLSDHHAFLAVDCANCHVDGTGLVKSLAHGLQHSEIAILEGHRCLECHDRGTFAFQAHSTDPAALALKTRERSESQRDDRSLMGEMQAGLGLPLSARGELACAACHREHRGRLTDLKQVSDALCQTCHVDGDDHFPELHPTFDSWPYPRRTRIIFDHARHQTQHFGEGGPRFDCRSCHETNATGFMETKPFEQACTSCHHHEEQIAGEAKSKAGFAILTAFGLDLETLEERGESVPNWPADGMDFEARPSALSLLLLRADESYPEREADLKLLTEVDLADLMDASDEEVAAAARLGRAFARLMKDLANEPTATLRHHLARFEPEMIPGEAESKPGLSDFEVALSASALTRTERRWFKSEGEIETVSDGEGRWYIDGSDPSLRYVPARHQDPVLGYLTTLAYRSGDAALIAEIEADGRCTKCHAVDTGPSGPEPQFRAAQPKGRGDLLHFDHHPHIRAFTAEAASTRTSTCVQCHVMEPGDAYLDSFKSRDPSLFRSGFQPLDLADCSSCHNESATRSSCVDCHNYHMR